MNGASAVAQLLSPQFAHDKVILFGSQARGDARTEGEVPEAFGRTVLLQLVVLLYAEDEALSKLLWLDGERDDVLARLLALNAERYEEGVGLGLHSKAAKQAAKVACVGGASGNRRGRPPKTAQAGEPEGQQAEQMGLGM